LKKQEKYKMKKKKAFVPKFCGEEADRKTAQLQTRTALMERRVIQRAEPRALENHAQRAGRSLNRVLATLGS
jgi:hypothetical protein